MGKNLICQQTVGCGMAGMAGRIHVAPHTLNYPIRGWDVIPMDMALAHATEIG